MSDGKPAADKILSFANCVFAVMGEEVTEVLLGLKSPLPHWVSTGNYVTTDITEAQQRNKPQAAWLNTPSHQSRKLVLVLVLFSYVRISSLFSLLQCLQRLLQFLQN